MRLILVEDKDSFRKLLMQALAGSGWELRATGDPEEAIQWMESGGAEVLVTDLRLPNFSGLELIRRAKRHFPGLRVVLMSAFAEPKDIVEAMRLGAEDFLPKPFDMDIFLATMDRLRALVGAPPPDPREPWVAISPVMRALDADLRSGADSEAPALFIGPRGAGKARAARRLHSLRHPRGPFLSLTAADAFSFPDSTLGLLQGGSLLIQGLEHLSPEGSGALLRAMNAPLGQGLQWMGTCANEDSVPESARLRLGVLRFGIPPIADHREDIIPLFCALLEQVATRDGRLAPGLDRNTEKQLLVRPWPGNARELAWTASQSLRSSEGMLIRELAATPMLGAMGGTVLPWPKQGPLESMLKEAQHHTEAALLRRALAAHKDDPVITAASLGLTLRAFATRAKEHGITLE